MLYKKLQRLGIIELDNLDNVKILDEEKFQNYFKDNYKSEEN